MVFCDTNSIDIDALYTILFAKIFTFYSNSS